MSDLTPKEYVYFVDLGGKVFQVLQEFVGKKTLSHSVIKIFWTADVSLRYNLSAIHIF